VTCHLDLLTGIVDTPELESEVVLMHISFCETIQKNVVGFSATLEKSYEQKNEILANGQES